MLCWVGVGVSKVVEWVGVSSRSSCCVGVSELLDGCPIGFIPDSKPILFFFYQKGP